MEVILTVLKLQNAPFPADFSVFTTDKIQEEGKVAVLLN